MGQAIDLEDAEYSAILVPSLLIRADTISDLSTFVESDPAIRPMEPDDGVNTALAFTTSGSPEEGRDIYLQVQRGGIPDGLRGLSLAWRNADTVDDAWNGWDNWTLQTGYRLPAWSTDTTLGYQTPDVLALPTGELVLAFDAPVATDQRAVKVRRWTPATKAWDTVDVDVWEDSGANVAGRVCPCLCRLPSGRILLFHLVYTVAITGDTYLQVWKWYSDDQGASWTRGQRNCFEGAGLNITTPVALTALVMRCAFFRGQLTLAITFANGSNGLLKRYASRDNGSTLQFVEDMVSPLGERFGLFVLVARGYFVVGTSGADGLQTWRGADAFSLMQASTATPSSTLDALLTLQIAAAVDEEGNVIVISGSTGSHLLFTPDAGDTWAPLAASYGEDFHWAAGQDPGILNPCAAYHRGRICLVGNYLGGGVAVFGLVEVQLGGYSAAAIPAGQTDPDIDSLATAAVPESLQPVWTQTWLPFQGTLDTMAGWTNADVGVPIANTTLGFELISTGPGVAANADWADVETFAAYPDLIVDGSWAALAGVVRIEVVCGKTGGGGLSTAVNVSIDHTQVSLVDNADGSKIVSAAHSLGTVDFRLMFKGRKASLWMWLNDGDSTRRFVLVGTLTGLTESAGAACSVRRHVDENSLVEGYGLRFLATALLGNTGSDGDLGIVQGRPASGAAPVYIDDGVSVRTVDGPGESGESFTMLSEGARPLRLALPSEAPSPSLYAEIENADDIIVRFDLDVAEPVSLGNDVIGVYIDGAVYGAELWGDDGSGPGKICDLVTSETLSYVRNGSTLVPSTGGITGLVPYRERNELAGGWVVLSPGVEDVTREIGGNSEGNWDEGAVDEKRPTITLTDSDAADPTDGSMVLVYPRTAHVISLETAPTYQWLWVKLNPSAVRADYPAPPWGRIRIRVLGIGPLAVFGHRTGRDHALETESLARVIDQPDMSSWSRAVGTRRTVEFSATSESIDVSTARGSSDPNYILASSGGAPVAHRADLPLMLQGLLEELDGPHRLVVWLPRIEQLGHGETVQSLTSGRAGGCVYGRIMSTVRQENVVGRPMRNEVLRGPRISLREEK